MKKSILLAVPTLILTAGSLAQADIISCNQTEPFIREVFDTDKGTVTVTTPETLKNPQVEKGLKLIIKGKGKFEILNADGTVRRTLVLNYDGSDGMSDLVYPFDGGAGYNGTIGCQSLELRAK